eukprot:CAMPEP_0177787718 /NCGR_PEP_ID=MMETSP0491_2-20121128/21671_1 /TAXON_ID=63592 /ORGANISM="Tetraselmis chuii, Strain PLY429" /LENGTH=47 /DNA_ID= /DNA_START= /DNA_END= /DNA_ORIENTATION=
MTTTIRDFKDVTLLERGIGSLRELIQSIEDVLKSAIELVSDLQLGGS